MARQTPVVSLRNMRKVYPPQTAGRLALADVTFEVARGEFACVVGPSGAGKTTLLRTLAGLCPPTSGEALFEGAPLRSVPTGHRRGVPGLRPLPVPVADRGRNMALPLRVRGISRPRGRLGQPRCSPRSASPTRPQYPWQLSGGMQQRVAIARALAYRPDLLLMDEPFASVDAQTRFELEDLILRVRHEFGVTVVFVTHDIDEAVYLADRVVVVSTSPGVVTETVDITLPKPRDQMATKADEAFSRYRRAPAGRRDGALKIFTGSRTAGPLLLAVLI